MAIIFDINEFITLDESVNPQNDDLPVTAPTGDLDDNDTTDPLPSDFSVALAALDADIYDFATFPGDALRPAEKAKSEGGYLNITTAGTLNNVAWTDVNGNLLTGASSGLFVGTDEILLYTDPTDDNVVYGTIGNTNVIAFAAYLEDLGGGDYDIWTTTYTAITHGDPTDADEADAIDPGVLHVSAFESIEFDLATLASGQNDWNRFGEFDAPAPGENAYQIIVIADEVATEGQTVNTSKGGGDTTIGNSNQLMNGMDPGKDVDGEAMIFTFVKNSGDLLLAGDTGDTDTINFEELQSANKGQWTISQTQGGSDFAEATMSAWTTTKETGTGFVPGLTGDTQIRITTVSVSGVGIDADPTTPDAEPFTATYNGIVFDGVVNVINMGERTVGKGKNADVFDVIATFNPDGSVTIEGLVAKDSIGYETLLDHNRLKLQNTGVDGETLPWDIGGFELLDAGRTTEDVGPQLQVEDAGPEISSILFDPVQEDALDNLQGVGIADDVSDTVTRTVDLANFVQPGTDAPAQFSLTNVAAGTGPSLASNGDTVTYNVVGNVLTASADDGSGPRTIFTLTLSGSQLTFLLIDQVDHTGAGDNETLTLILTDFIVVTDAEGDPAAFTGPVSIAIENDIPADSGTDEAVFVAEDALLGGILNDTPDNDDGGGVADDADVATQSGNLSSLVTSGADEEVTWAWGSLAGLPGGLESNGNTVTWSINASDELVAVADGSEILSISLGTDGAYTVTLIDQFDHSGVNNDEEQITIDLSSALDATDADGDTVSPGANSFVLNIENDLPTIATIADSNVDFTTIDGANPDDAGGTSTPTATNPLNISDGADEDTTYVFSDFTTDTSVIPNLIGEAIGSDTRIVWYVDQDGIAGFSEADDLLYFDATLDQTLATYTFTVHQDPPPASKDFDLGTLAPGIYDWNTFGDADVQVIVTSDTLGQNVNTSSGGGPTTIANSNQLINGVSGKDSDGNALVFTFVQGSPGLIDGTGADQDYTDLSSIDYDALFNTRAASWSISQTQGGDDFSVATLTAVTTDKEVGGGYFPGIGDGDDAMNTETIRSVTVTNSDGFSFTAIRGDTEDDFITRIFGTGGSADEFLFDVEFLTGGEVIVNGLREGDDIAYTTDDTHNRLFVQNTGLEADTLPYDIGGFSIEEAQPTPDQVFTTEVTATDADGDTAVSNTFSMFVDGTGIYDDDVFDLNVV